MKVNFYIGDVNSQGGSKVSLLNNILFLKERRKPFNVYTNGTGWFTNVLETRNIPYTIIKEPFLFTKISKKTPTLLIILIGILSSPKLLYTWYKISKKIKKGTIVINEPRDITLFFPLLFNDKLNKIQWVRGERVGKLSKGIMSHSDLIVGVSDEVLKSIKVSTDTPSVRVYNFLNDPVVISKSPRKISKKIVINLAVVGSIQPIKGQLDALKTLKILLERNYDTRLFIVGKVFDSNYAGEIQNYIKNNNLSESIIFTGQLANVIKFMKEKLELLLVPSQTESFCRVAMEAMSVGIPVIAYKVGGLKEVVSDSETGFLIEKDNIKSLSKKIMFLIDNPTEYEKLSYNSRVSWEKKFSKNAIEYDLLEVFYGGEK